MNATLSKKQQRVEKDLSPAEADLYRQLDALRLGDYFDAATRGRADVPRALRQAFKDINETAAFVLKTNETHELAVFAKAVTEGESLLLGLDKPRYIGYSNLPVLEWYLGTESPLALAEHRTRAWRAFAVLANDLCDWHNRRANAWEPQSANTEFHRPERTEKIEGLRKLIPQDCHPRFMAKPDNQFPDLVQYINDPDATLHDLSAFPQSSVPDEYLFLRAIHLAEVGFWGASVHIHHALAKLERGERGDDLVLMLKQGEQFARTLAPIMQVVHSMLTETFAAFRDATGDSSAVQSARYQYLEAQLYGVLPEKRGVLENIPEARRALDWNDAGNRPLTMFVEEVRAEGHEDLAIAISDLEKHVHGWRQFHRRRLAAGGYLPPEAHGTGGTSGLSYLESHKPPRPKKHKFVLF